MPKQKSKPGVVYLLTNLVNRKIYVGKTHASLKKRWQGHCHDAKSGRNMVICRAIRKYGSDNFSMRIIGRATTPNELNLMETSWIAKLKTRVPNGYNSTDGGEGTVGAVKGKKLREEISENTKRYFENHPEARKALSLITTAHFKTAKGRRQAKNHSKLMRERAAHPKLGKRLGAGLKKAWKDPKFRAKMSTIRRKQFTPEVREKIIASLAKYRRSKEGNKNAIKLHKKLKTVRKRWYADPNNFKSHREAMQRYFRSKAGKAMHKRRAKILRSPEVRSKISKTVKRLWKEGRYESIRKH